MFRTFCLFALSFIVTVVVSGVFLPVVFDEIDKYILELEAQNDD